MIDIAALRVMVAAGMSAGAIVDVIEADRKSDIEAAAAKREAARQRQIKCRATKKANEINDRVTNVTVTGRDTRDSELPISSLLPSSLTSTDSLLEKKEEVLESGRARSNGHAKSKRKQGHALPDDWRPNEKHAAEAVKLGRGLPWMLGLADEMRFWAKSEDHRAVARKSDWDATFMSWMRREASKSRAPPTNGHAPRPGSREDRQERLANVLQSIDPRTRPDADDDRRGEGAAAPIARLLPFGGGYRS